MGNLSKNISDKSINLLFCEVVERLIRFQQHINKIREQFFFDETKETDKINFLDSYQSVIKKLLEIACKTIRSNKRNDWKLGVLKSTLGEIRTLHRDQLNHLPKPSEPNELRRFARIINKQISKFNKISSSKNSHQFKEISIYTTKEVDEETYLGDPLNEYKQKSLNNTIISHSLNVSKFKNQPDEERYHITIPRIDAFNPCRWPTLMHEMGHHLGENIKFFRYKSIEQDFLSTLETQRQKDFVSELINKSSIKLNRWLIESWCDLLAAAIMGPSFWFSQFSAFIFSGDYQLRPSHPFPMFRLMLIHKILAKRLPNTLTHETEQLITEYRSVIEIFDENFQNPQFLEFFKLFLSYFTRTFFIKKKSDGSRLGSQEFNETIEPLLEYTRSINESTIYELSLNLKNGYPIPSRLITLDEITETFTSIQEIIQTAWIVRADFLKNRIMKDALGRKKPDLDNLLDMGVDRLDKFDLSILKSIQVSEWFNLFFDKRNEKDIDDHLSRIKHQNATLYDGQLVDFEIYQALKKRNLKVIPLINPKQIGTTSIDIRLGTTFQYYYPSQKGIIDFTDTHSITSGEQSSKQVDLDYLDSITIGPGQFLLGHSMEYFELDDTISASLDGRSSFARSGLEIHMTAGFVEPGFVGVITFEFFNAGPNSIKLFPGIRIGQLRFHKVNEPVETYKKKGEAKYKGHLSHHHGLQTKDSEISIIKESIREKEDISRMRGFMNIMKNVPKEKFMEDMAEFYDEMRAENGN